MKKIIQKIKKNFINLKVFCSNFFVLAQINRKNDCNSLCLWQGLINRISLKILNIFNICSRRIDTKTRAASSIVPAYTNAKNQGAIANLNILEI